MDTYLDESGNFTTGDNKYFIVGTYTVDDPRKLAKAFRKWQRSKFPRRLRGETEVKFNNTSLDNTLRLKTLQFLCKQDIKTFYTFLKKKNIPKEYYKKGKVHETGLLYTHVVRATLELYMPVTESKFIITRDQRTLKGVTVDQFNDVLKAGLLPKLPAKVLLQILAVDSTTNPLVQIADWICGALARYHEGKSKGKEFYTILKNNIVGEKELFSEK